ncbi:MULTISPECIES: haloacid dehalogenase type II [Amycolatopsis]|uniref:Haloacid dehalogenase type II n=1 Tax=Amycolatopsis albidoflavus TaxID=102226 RepID=A0ABW5I745_9PSEU
MGNLTGLGDVDAVFFDVQGTLTDFAAPVSEALAQELPRLTASQRAEVLVRWRQFWTANTSGTPDRRWRSSRAVYSDGLAGIARDLGFKVDPSAHERLVHAWTQQRPWPDTAAGLDKLRDQGVVVSAFSNVDTAVIVDLARRHGWHWDLVLTAELVGRFKAHPDMYRTAIASVATEPARCALVASHSYDLAAAAEAGMRTVYIHRPGEFGGALIPERPAPGMFDLVIDAVSALVL